MKVQHTKTERMGENGKSLLRILQNETIPLIDLFVREGLQNSLDATLDDAKETIVNIGAVEFDVNQLGCYLEGIGDTLAKRYNEHSPKAIYLSDKNTSGLTGAIRDEQNTNIFESKIYKLIYGISMNQNQSGAGGSWGLGKTSFFRIGNGIVIYYTRVKKDDGAFEERMAASLIEDSEKKDALLSRNSRGIAWWGARENDDLFADTYPITDEVEIGSILNIFEINRYKGGETGTTVIVPFIDEKKIFSHDETHDDKTIDKDINWWDESLNERLKIAVQKWYGPRIMNKEYQIKYGSCLLPFIDGELLSPDKFQPFFRVIRQLYTQALIGGSTNQIIVKPIEIERMALSKYSDKIAGDFAFAKVNARDLEMMPPDNNPHPLSYLENTEKDSLLTNNAKIVAFARKPGMIIDYDVNGLWSQNVSKLENEFIIGFFVPRSDQELHENFQGELSKLDDYLRKTENADHATWEDVLVKDKKVTIVRRIRNKTADKLSNEFDEELNNRQSSKTSVLGRKLGTKLLPPTNFGKTGRIKPEVVDPKTEKKQGKRTYSLTIKGLDRLSDDTLAVKADIHISASKRGAVFVNVNMGSNNYNAEKWMAEMGENAEYPFKIESIRVQTVNDEKIEENVDFTKDDRFNIAFSIFDNASTFEIENNTENEDLKLEMEMIVKFKDPLIQPYIQAKEVK